MTFENLRLRPFVMAIQASAIFVAFSIFLGRIYYLTMYQTLDIRSTISLTNVLDYAIISPNVTLLCISLSIIGMVHVFFLKELLSIGRLVDHKICFTIIFLLIGLTLTYFGPSIYKLIWRQLPVAYGFLQSMSIVATTFSGIFLSNSIVMAVETKLLSIVETDSDKNEIPEKGGLYQRLSFGLIRFLGTRFSRLETTEPIGLVVIFMIAVWVLLSSMFYASRVGSLDAINMIDDAPIVAVMFDKSKELDLGYFDRLDCDFVNYRCHGKLILVGSEFVHLTASKRATDGALYSYSIDKEVVVGIRNYVD